LFCLACGSEEICARGLCRSCYGAAYHGDSYFAGAKANVLARDGHGCRVCGEATNVVHHRRPGCDQEKWLITLCPACHATVERLERVDRYLPPLLLALWREQHPEAGEQLAFALDAPLEVTTADPSKQQLDWEKHGDERRNSTCSRFFSPGAVFASARGKTPPAGGAGRK
jgi:hypothetical protein